MYFLSDLHSNFVPLCRLKQNKAMTVVSNKGFTYRKKYFDLSVNEEILFRGDDSVKKERVHLEPDEDLRRAITADELLERIYNDIDKKFANRNK